MTDEVPDPPSNDAPRPPLEEVPAEVFHALNDALEGTRRAAFLAEAMRTQTTLALWDTVVLDETARGLVAREGGRAERAFAVHLAGLLHVSRNRAVSMLHTAQSLRGLAVSYGLFLTGAFAWASAEAVVRNLGGLTGRRGNGTTWARRSSQRIWRRNCWTRNCPGCTTHWTTTTRPTAVRPRTGSGACAPARAQVVPVCSP